MLTVGRRIVGMVAEVTGTETGVAAPVGTEADTVGVVSTPGWLHC
jgi:hypothetical protein